MYRREAITIARDKKKSKLTFAVLLSFITKRKIKRIAASIANPKKDILKHFFTPNFKFC